MPAEAKVVYYPPEAEQWEREAEKRQNKYVGRAREFFGTLQQKFGRAEPDAPKPEETKSKIDLGMAYNANQAQLEIPERDVDSKLTEIRKNSAIFGMDRGYKGATENPYVVTGMERGKYGATTCFAYMKTGENVSTKLVWQPKRVTEEDEMLQNDIDLIQRCNNGIISTHKIGMS